MAPVKGPSGAPSMAAPVKREKVTAHIGRVDIYVVDVSRLPK